MVRPCPSESSAKIPRDKFVVEAVLKEDLETSYVVVEGEVRDSGRQSSARVFVRLPTRGKKRVDVVLPERTERTIAMKAHQRSQDAAITPHGCRSSSRADVVEEAVYALRQGQFFKSHGAGSSALDEIVKRCARRLALRSVKVTGVRRCAPVSLSRALWSGPVQPPAIPKPQN